MAVVPETADKRSDFTAQRAPVVGAIPLRCQPSHDHDFQQGGKSNAQVNPSTER